MAGNRVTTHLDRLLSRTPRDTATALNANPGAAEGTKQENQGNRCGGRRLGCAVGGVILAWKVAQTDGPLIFERGTVIGSTGRIGQPVAGALLG